MDRVSFTERKNGTYRVRWREENGKEGNRTVWAERGKVVKTLLEATHLQSDVLRALETRGYYEAPPRVAPARPRKVADGLTNPEDAAASYLRELLVNGDSPNSIKRWGYALKSCFRMLREVAGVPADQVFPVERLNREIITQARVGWEANGIAPRTIHLNTTRLLDLWAWMHEDPTKWPGVPQPPTRRKGLTRKLPPAMPSAAPTVAEMDAVLRELAKDWRRRVPLHICIVARFTGLRVSQILKLRRGDLDIEARTLRVQTGKSAREKLGRVMPVSQHLIDALCPVLDRTHDQWLVRQVRAGGDSASPANIPYSGVKIAWQTACADGLVRQEVLEPETRRKQRPFHAFRAGFMAALENLGTATSDIQRLVGHAASTSARHYVDDKSVAGNLHKAVDAIPPIDWEGPSTTNITDASRAA